MKARGTGRRAAVIPAAVLAAVLAAAAAGAAGNREEADRLFAAEDWAGAAAAYAAITGADPSDAAAWFRLGQSRKHLGEFEAAVAAFEAAETAGFQPPRTRFEIGCAFAAMKRADEAFRWLDRAVEAGFGGIILVDSDAGLNPVRDDARFAAFRDRVDRNARPCEYDSRFRQFDFWIGEWDVFDPRGRLVGTNSITRIANGCALLEHWNGTSGSTGQSLNYFDAAAGKWIQRWIDGRGGTIPQEGEFRDGAMHLRGVNRSLDGTTELFRGTWTPLPDGRVRQFLEQSRDDGRTWYVWFDGTYVPRGNPGGSGS